MSTLNVTNIKSADGTSGLSIANSTGVITLPSAPLIKACAFKMHPSGNQSMGNGAETAFAFGTAAIDTNSIVDLSNNRVVITAATAGLWWLSFTTRLKNSSPQRHVIYIKVNGSSKFTFEENQSGDGTTSGSQSLATGGIFGLSSGDILTYHLYHNQGSARDIEFGVDSSRAEGYRIGTL